jgi:hypothetical protein
MTTVCGLTIQFEIMSLGWSKDGWDFIVIMRRFGDVVPNMGSRRGRSARAVTASSDTQSLHSDSLVYKGGQSGF